MTPLDARPAQQALAVIDQWANAFSNSDVETIVGLYAEDALFLGTQTKELGVTATGVRAYFEASLLNNRPRHARLTQCRVKVLSETVVAVSGLDELSGVRDCKPYTTTGRVTFVVAQRNSVWQIVQFHRSILPR